MIRIFTLARTLFYLAGTGFFVFLAALMYRAVPVIQARDAQIAQLLTTVNTTTTVNSLNIERAVANVVSLTADVGESVEQINHTVQHVDREIDPVVASLQITIHDADAATTTLNTQLSDLGTAWVADLAPVPDTLHDLQTQMNSVGPVLTSLNQSIQDTDRLVADPNIAKTVENVQETTKSLDMSTRSLRQKAGVVKRILMMLIQPAATVAAAIFTH